MDNVLGFLLSGAVDQEQDFRSGEHSMISLQSPYHITLAVVSKAEAPSGHPIHDRAHLRAGKCLPCKNDVLSLIPKPAFKKANQSDRAVLDCNAGTGRSRQTDPWGWGAGQPSLFSKLQAVTKERHMKLLSASAHMCTHT